MNGAAKRLLKAAWTTGTRSASSSSAAEAPVRSNVSNGVFTLTLASPKTRNALSLNTMRAFREELRLAAVNEQVRIVVVRGEGPAFSSGHNLKELTSDDGVEHHTKVFRECGELMRDIISLPVPVVAAVDGIAAAAGCQMVAACDIVVATSRAAFSTPGAAFGLFCSTPGVTLARAVNKKVAGYMLLTGEAISAEDAFRAGLVSKLVAPENLEAEIGSICEAIKAKPKAVIRLGKRFFHHQVELGISQALDEGGNVMVENLKLADAQEGIGAFKEKRKPVWTHSDSRK